MKNLLFKIVNISFKVLFDGLSALDRHLNLERTTYWHDLYHNTNSKASLDVNHEAIDQSLRAKFEPCDELGFCSLMCLLAFLIYLLLVLSGHYI